MLQLSRSNTAENLSLQPADGVDLGPARVTKDARGREVEVKLDSGERVNAQLALALPYAAVADDIVLVLSKGERHYVVGVLDGAGITQLQFRGDVAVKAIGGSLTLEADEGVKVHGKKLSFVAQEIEVVATSLIERLQSVYQRVHGLLNVRAESMTTTVDETSRIRAKRASIVTEENIRINGEQIRLG